ncbi:DHHC family palmitoyltransferase [Rhodotorula paludigena]|uniref:DHHC family palmitoyltransferase n=1 Tax=Rhodotorula paludigena TaxID=86838 RepID=UPI00317D4950
MGCLAGASRRVNRAFRSFERFVGRHVDRTTRVLQPVFVAAAISLISLCAFAFFEAVYPEVFLAPDTPWWKWAVGTAWCGYLVVMMVFHKEQSSTRADRYARVCKKCEPTTSGGRPPKPERTHHCSVCATCILKFDHHCPWIKGCVGLHNERYFTLFLCYFSVASLFAAYWGLRPTLRGLSFVRNSWDHLTPRIVMLLSEVLTTIMGFAVLVMCLSQLHLIMRNQTNVESSDNDWYRKVALSRGRTFLNPYDLGWRENFREFFNIGAASEGRYHWLTVFLPLAIPPVSDGWTWRKREDWHDYAMSHEDELTDEEEPDSDEEVEQVAVD